MSKIEDELLFDLIAIGMPEPVREYRFAPPRKFRADFAYPDKMILIECEGGTWTNGRHNRPVGFSRDCEKYNLAASMGFMVLRFTSAMIHSGVAVNTIEEVYKTSKRSA